MSYDELPIFDLRNGQPEINLYRVQFDSATSVQSMVKRIEIANVFRAADSEKRYLFFIADNALLVDVSDGNGVNIRINKIAVEVATIFFNKAISFVPCFKYADSEDVILFASRNIHYLVDQGGQFATDYYGMKHELIECINSDEVFVDLNDEHVFKKFKLSELLTESKTVVYAPDFLLQVPSRQQLINLLDLAVYVRNVSFFILVLFYLRRSSIALEFIEKEEKIIKITGPWKEAILYVLNAGSPNTHYDAIFSQQFFDLNQHEKLPLGEFIEALCNNFCKYQRFTDDGQYQIIPTAKQKDFLQRIIRAERCFHFSEVGSGKTKVILPLLCQTFLSNNQEAHKCFARGGKSKHTLIILVPEHLVPDARSQVFRYCLNLNFREEYRVYDDIFALLHHDVTLAGASDASRFVRPSSGRVAMKQIFVTSFNLLKKALTYDSICAKVRPYREHILVVADEVDDFLDRDKLVFNICSNKGNAFDRPTLELFFEVSRAAYQGRSCLGECVDSSNNPAYWKQLLEKFSAIHAEIQDASKSVNKSFGIFNEQTLRHCNTNIAHDIEGYKSLIARPYESVNRAMPGSYYSDVERTIYLTYVILTEDITKYDELFQQERKFISFEYWNAHVRQLDYDDLAYGHDRLSELVVKHPEIKDGLTRFLYEIILRRMEIRDKSRSVNSIDVVFNFDCVGFTGTPFIDNYPTFAYIRHQREDEIPDLIDRSFYAYTSDALSVQQFEERMACFQGLNNNVLMEYVNSDWMQSKDELTILQQIFTREESAGTAPLAEKVGGGTDHRRHSFNVLVDLCGIFKRSSIHDVRDLVVRHFGPDHFHFIYHIDQADSSDRVLCINSDNDVQFDEEFYKHLCKTYGADLRHRVFFFVDNRNVIGKDIPFQLVYQRRFAQPMFTKSVVLAHDVDDFSKIWQAMGRSRTMNATIFSVYKSGIPDDMVIEGVGVQDIKKHALTRLLYVRNCDMKMAGNLSSIYQTLISLFNLSQDSFYYCDEIVNSFLEKMEMTIAGKVQKHESKLANHVLGTSVPARILAHMLASKFRKSYSPAVVQAAGSLTPAVLEALLRHIVQQKFEQRPPSGDVYDEFICFLSGEQQSLMEISYTKQQQKQKQKQQNKNQDADNMEIFDEKNQLCISREIDDYFKYTSGHTDIAKTSLNLPISVPILRLTYVLGGQKRAISVYPTLQFLCSHHIQAEYISPQVKKDVASFSEDGDNPHKFCKRFLEAAKNALKLQQGEEGDDNVLDVGTMVLLHGLNKEEYNGQRGRIVCEGDTNGSQLDMRWGVQLVGTEPTSKPISLKAANLRAVPADANDPVVGQLRIKVKVNNIRQNPQYTLAALQEGVYVIGMKDQFNVHDLQGHPIHERIQYIVDDMGFVLFDRAEQASASTKSVDSFGPYFIEHYMLMEVLSKQEVAQNVLDYFVNHKAKLQRVQRGTGQRLHLLAVSYQ
eukprot:gnl/MRDRNA2_/MRDRNA2_58642_c0_seq1.p1 gnl/MRDRNA2_/MRDRNA2_58642_c0~~gnl/MRDRNA2_/MRDRNA2_58642_c0_seq1.p1  ORF type:complete len:1612 (+),score=292.79 gnl/MRDRNA2_/MRDRNA2_58642_c0_seq1:504-4838(+)